MKTALITGGTDGIGAALAISLSRRGYAVHITGRNEERADEVLQTLKAARPDADHRKYLFDMSDIGTIQSFLDSYQANHSSLDLLVLNANSASKSKTLTNDGVDMNFAVGYLSRYMLSAALDEMLKQSAGRVLHLGVASQARKLDFDKIQRTDYGIIKATAQAYAADTLLAYHLNTQKITTVPHEMHDPGFVNTRQVREQNFLVRGLARLIGLTEPEVIGEILADHIQTTNPDDGADKNFKQGKSAKVSRYVTHAKADFDRLMQLSKDLTKMEFERG